jgi:hypothetical protein
MIHGDTHEGRQDNNPGMSPPRLSLTPPPPRLSHRDMALRVAALPVGGLVACMLIGRNKKC